MTPFDEPFLFDAPPLLHGAKADRLDVIGDLVRGHDCLTTQSVLDEVRRNDPDAHAVVVRAPWVRTVPTDSLEFLGRFDIWSTRISLKDGHNIGETMLCAYADLQGGTLVIDDRDARKVAERYGLVVCGTMRLIADACVRSDLTLAGASSLADTLLESGMRLPFARGGFEAWARRENLLG
ncbi:hypothetical protein [Nocardiopsis valliformis]|uniref:hypothetical protein n=1 Tax=Nocardiopsis valliformis TaxID=239974 RepID=UPI00034AC4DF|nr:hypothetical protein [Nocardiopsis valliformis]